MSTHKIREYADADEVDSLPTADDLEQVQQKIVRYYKKFLHGDCSPLKNEIPQLKEVLVKLKEVEAMILKIYNNH